MFKHEMKSQSLCTHQGIPDEDLRWFPYTIQEASQSLGTHQGVSDFEERIAQAIRHPELWQFLSAHQDVSDHRYDHLQYVDPLEKKSQSLLIDQGASDVVLGIFQR